MADKCDAQRDKENTVAVAVVHTKEIAEELLPLSSPRPPALLPPKPLSLWRGRRRFLSAASAAAAATVKVVEVCKVVVENAAAAATVEVVEVHNSVRTGRGEESY